MSDTRFEFDLDNDGATEEIRFAASGSGFLSFDRNRDGIMEKQIRRIFNIESKSGNRRKNANFF